MKLADISSGPDYIVWVVFAIFLILAVVLLSGHGSGLIAGYNTASKEEKSKYDTKKLCRVVGAGMAVISMLILIAGVFKHILPASFAYLMLGIIVMDCLVTLIAANILCRKR